MPVRIWRVTTAALAAVAAAVALVGCSSGSSGSSPVWVGSSGLPSSGSAESSRAPIRSTGLASALGLVPDMPAGAVFYTDWSALGHQDRSGPTTASFAGLLVNNDDSLHHDLGIRSTDAQWEVDVERVNRPPLVLLGFGERSDLSGLADKLTSFGYRADGSLFAGTVNPNRIWTIGLPNIGIDRARHLLVGGRDVSAIRSVLAGPANPLGREDAVTPLLQLASAKLGQIATASISVGSMACVHLSDLTRGRGTPEILATLHKYFSGTFDPPQAEITALANPTDKTALDALTFPDEGTARANETSRSAALNTLSTWDGPAETIWLTRSAVTGQVLSFSLSAQQPYAFRQRVLDQTLGVDICP